MLQMHQVAEYPRSVPLNADSITEFHAARLLLLILKCRGGKVVGLTKLAKLDFFVRYPDYFASVTGSRGRTGEIESAMIRHHYGPWDHRYYAVLGYLESRALLKIARQSTRTFTFALTERGVAAAEALAQDEAFDDLNAQIGTVVDEFGRLTGSAIKDLIYASFDFEVGRRQLGEVIE